jgi:hypothetical protein
MSKKIPNWIKNVLMFGGIPTIALLISNNVSAQNQITTVKIDSITITKSYQDSITYKSNGTDYPDTCNCVKVFNSGTTKNIPQTSQSGPLNNGDNKNINSTPCIRVLGKNNSDKNNCIFYFIRETRAHSN